MKKKTQYHYMKEIRKDMPPPSHAHASKKKLLLNKIHMDELDEEIESWEEDYE